VKLALTPKEGYKFAENVSAKLNGKTATVETFDDGSINVSVKLTTLSKEHKHTNSVWKTDKDNHWKVCTDTACGTITVAKEAHKDQNKDNKCDICAHAISKENTTPTEKPITSELTTFKPTESEPTNSGSNDSSVTDPTDDEIQETDGETEESDTTVENEENKIDKTDNNKTNGGLIWIVLGAVIVLVAGGAVTFIVIKKKKAE